MSIKIVHEGNNINLIHDEIKIVHKIKEGLSNKRKTFKRENSLNKFANLFNLENLKAKLVCEITHMQ